VSVTLVPVQVLTDVDNSIGEDKGITLITNAGLTTPVQGKRVQMKVKLVIDAGETVIVGVFAPVDQVIVFPKPLHPLAVSIRLSP
jgi:hypothetical protein